MSSLPETFKAVLVKETGPSSVLQIKDDVPLPKVRENEVLVRNTYSGINYIDVYFRTGVFPRDQYPYIPGEEGAGYIAQDGHGFQQGERVAYTSSQSYGQYTAVPVEQVVRLPDSVDDETGAAAFLQGLTALTMVDIAACVKKGQWALVHAAAGGVGRLLVQILRARGAKIIATASTAEKGKLVSEAGADYFINYSTEDWVARVKEITNQQGVDAILDGVGKATFDGDLEVIAYNSRLVSFGNASGVVPPLHIGRLSAKNTAVLRPSLSHYLREPEQRHKITTELLRLITSGELKINIHRVYPLEQVKQAQDDLESRGTTGKLLLKID